jgi:hypothetical protein
VRVHLFYGASPKKTTKNEETCTWKKTVHWESL